MDGWAPQGRGTAKRPWDPHAPQHPEWWAPDQPPRHSSTGPQRALPPGWDAPRKAAEEAADPPRRRTRRPSLRAVAFLVIAGVLTGVAVAVSRVRDDPSAGEAHPSATLSARPATATPSRVLPSAPGGAPGPAWQLPERVWEPLPASDPSSPLYLAQITPLDDLSPPTLVGCPAPAVNDSEAQWRASVAAQWDCVHDAWRPTLADLGLPDARPELHFYEGRSAVSECGTVEGPAFYCSSPPGSGYFGSEHLAMTRSWDLSVNEMVNHEYGHHLQALFGITAIKGRAGGLGAERRSELQALCLSAMMTRHNSSVGFDGAHYDSWQDRLDSMLIDGVHGSRESIRYWGTRGLYAAAVGDCDTWVAPAHLVT